MNVAVEIYSFEWAETLKKAARRKNPLCVIGFDARTINGETIPILLIKNLKPIQAKNIAKFANEVQGYKFYVATEM